MADNTGQFAVKDVLVRPTPIIGPNGQVTRETTVTFGVGPHGSFTLVYPGAAPDPAKITADIKAQVDQLRQLAQNVAQLNQQP